MLWNVHCYNTCNYSTTAAVNACTMNRLVYKYLQNLAKSVLKARSCR